ncbi:MAG: methyltransferase domain-containing protein [bacterium]|nr:methyltransferase domain-containing protein [bacterium]
MTDLEFTGERVVPGKSPADLIEEHRARYEFALEFVKGKKIIDIGCGSGYGTSMLATAAEKVVGVDISEEAILSAGERYSSGNVEFRVGGVSGLQFRDGEFDAGVCFEVIEHIENPQALLKEACRVIKDGGVFIASTPNSAVKVSSQKNPFHFREYSLSEFRELLVVSLPSSKWDIDIFGQFIKGKKYSGFCVAVKNIYLSVKGLLGIKPKSKPVDSGDKSESSISFEFRNEHAELAEYLIAVVKGRK